MADQTDKSFLGQGWAFPLRLSGGDFALVPGERDIEEAIWIILDTAFGERAMRPEFGVGLHRMVFEPLSSATISLVQYRVQQSLQTWESRIDVKQVDVRADPARRGVLQIDIRYRVRDTNTFSNMVYPLYLREGGGA